MGADIVPRYDLAHIGDSTQVHGVRDGSADKPDSTVPRHLRVGGIIFRTLFLIVLMVLTVRVSFPQNAHIWNIYNAPGDLVRLLLGGAVCIVILVQLFRRPGDPNAYQVWFYLGLAALPFTIISAIGTW